MFLLTSSLRFLLLLSFFGHKMASAQSELTTPFPTSSTTSNQEQSNSPTTAGWCAYDMQGCYRETEKAFECKAYQHRICNCPKPAENGTFCTDVFQHPQDPAFQQLIRSSDEQQLCAKRSPQTCPVLEQMVGWPFPVGRDVLPNPIGWCPWSLWGRWSVSCGAAERIRQRRCLCGGSLDLSEMERLMYCNGKSWEQESESRQDKIDWSCPNYSNWCSWTQWSQERCSVCVDSNLENTRTRQCACPKIFNTTCYGDSIETCNSCPSNENALSSTTLAIILFVLLVITVSVSCIICDRYTPLCTIRTAKRKVDSSDAKEEMLVCEMEQNAESGRDAKNLCHSNVHIQIINEDLHDDEDL